MELNRSSLRRRICIVSFGGRQHAFQHHRKENEHTNTQQTLIKQEQLLMKLLSFPDSFSMPRWICSRLSLMSVSVQHRHIDIHTDRQADFHLHKRKLFRVFLRHPDRDKSELFWFSLWWVLDRDKHIMLRCQITLVKQMKPLQTPPAGYIFQKMRARETRGP